MWMMLLHLHINLKLASYVERSPLMWMMLLHLHINLKLASYVEGSPLMWMMLLHLHLNLNADDDDIDCTISVPP